MKFKICFFFLFIPFFAFSQTTALKSLQNEIERIEKNHSGGQLGVGVYHLGSGQSIYHHQAESFPMASTYKVAIAVQLLKRVEKGELSLDKMIELQPGDLHPGSGTLTRLFDDPGVILSVRNLLELMMLISDNSATDVCMRLAGGPDAINSMLKENGIEGMRLDRPTIKLIADYVGITPLPPEEEWTKESFNELYKNVSKEEREKANAAFNEDPQDTSTPEAMAILLRKIWKGEILNQENSALLRDIMYRCQTGSNRIKGLLPSGTRVANKTGTIGKTTNDAGVIDLPDDAGQVIVVLFVKNSEKEISEREEAIAHAARAVYDYFLFRD